MIIKQVYSEKTRLVYTLSCCILGFNYTFAKPTKGVYEYICTEIDKKTQTLGNIVVKNNIAVKEVIALPDWLALDSLIELEITQKLLESDYTAFVIMQITRNIPFFYLENGLRKAYVNRITISDLPCTLVGNLIIPQDNRLKIRQKPNINFSIEDGSIQHSFN